MELHILPCDRIEPAELQIAELSQHAEGDGAELASAKAAQRRVVECKGAHALAQRIPAGLRERHGCRGIRIPRVFKVGIVRSLGKDRPESCMGILLER